MKTQQSATIRKAINALTMSFVLAFILTGCQKDESASMSSANNSNGSLAANAHREGEVTIELKLFIQSYFQPNLNGPGGLLTAVLQNSGMVSSSTDCDEVFVDLRLNNEPQTIAYTSSGILNCRGNLVVSFSEKVLSTEPYWIVIRHRSSVETWSARPVQINENTSYDFTTSSDMAYDGNMVEVAKDIWAMYSGDINQDGNIDLSDFVILQDAADQFASGYISSDLSGDGNVDLSDFPFMEKNISDFVYSHTPLN